MAYSHGKKWTDQSVETGIREVMEYHGINRMPSRSEIRNSHIIGLAEKISREGYKKWADRLGLEIKYCETSFGKQMERFITTELNERGHLVEQMNQNFPYDLLVDNIVKIDVKASKLFKGKEGNFFAFSLEKKVFVCDFYLLCCVSDSGKVLRQYVIPAYLVSHNCQFSIGEHSSKYDPYIGRYDLIKLFISQIKKVV